MSDDAERWLEEVAPRCSVCGLTQTTGVDGPTCANGHLGAATMSAVVTTNDEVTHQQRGRITWEQAVRRAREADARRARSRA